MIFDRQEHKQIVLQLIEQTNFPGTVLELVCELKSAVIMAAISGDAEDDRQK